MDSPAATILIVDDEIQNRRLLEALLRHEGYVTLSVASGEEALVSIAQSAPDLILLDIMMPGMDGYQLARKLKADPATSNIPIIMVTALLDRSARLAGLDAGAEEFLTKPFDRDELWLRVRNLLRLKAYSDFLLSHNTTLEQQVAARTSDLQDANSALAKENMVDPLTGLKNRRYLSAFMPEELALCIRQQALQEQAPCPSGPNIDLCLLMVDLDHFKSINDSHGHAAGDTVLRQVGQLLRVTFRESDVVVRWGGDEFLILARNADRAKAKGLASNICEAVRSHPFDLGNGLVLRKTCSVGFTAFPLVPGQPERFGWEAAVDLADQCLFAAKHSGRNGWVGCLVKDNVQTDAEGTLPRAKELASRGQCLILSSFADCPAPQWEHPG